MTVALPAASVCCVNTEMERYEVSEDGPTTRAQARWQAAPPSFWGRQSGDLGDARIALRITRTHALYSAVRSTKGLVTGLARKLLVRSVQLAKVAQGTKVGTIPWTIQYGHIPFSQSVRMRRIRINHLLQDCDGYKVAEAVSAPHPAVPPKQEGFLPPHGRKESV